MNNITENAKQTALFLMEKGVLRMGRVRKHLKDAKDAGYVGLNSRGIAAYKGYELALEVYDKLGK